MYRSAYAEVLEDKGSELRSREKDAFEHAIALLKIAANAGPSTVEAVDAILFLNRLWSVLLEDLAKPDNALAPELRANLISIGIWSMREADRVRVGESSNFKGLIDVAESISGGLS